MSADSTRLKDQAIIAVQKVEEKKSWLDLLMPKDLNELPIGLKRTLNNVTYKLAISSIVSHKNHYELTVFARVELPQSPGVLFFGASGIKLSRSGKIIGDGKLVLLGDVSIPLGSGAALVLKGDFSTSNGQTSGDLTYITMDCAGFKEMGIAADVVFPRSMLIPCTPDGDKVADENQLVKGSFQTRVSDWSNILGTISLPKFQVSQLDGVVFNVNKATFDFSETRNSPDLIFPAGYTYRHMNAFPSTNGWKGVFIQAVDVTLPKAFQRKGGQRISFGAKNLIVDHNGLTGLLYGKNILPYSEGDVSGWKFSVEEFDVGLEANRLVKAGFRGSIGLPIAEKDSLRYEAIITGSNQYQLTVAPKGKMDFQLWQAKAELEANSYVKLLLDNDQFKPEANLFGRFSVSAKMNPDGEKTVAEFKGITFRGLRLRTMSPYMTVDYLGYDGEVSVAGFPVSINEIALVTNNNRADLAFNLNVVLQEQTFKGSTRLTLGARFGNDGGHHRYHFDKVRINSIEIRDVEISGVLKLNGRVDFMNNDPLYGDGFGGGIEAKIGPIGGAVIKMRCMFGHSTFRYWFIDGHLGVGDGIPLLGALNVHGFAGGAYYRMSKIGAGATTDKLKPNYKPDAGMGLGLKAGILFNVVKRDAVDGVAEFEIAFNAGGGVKYIGLFGNARFMSKAGGAAGSALEASAKALTDAEDALTKQLEGLSEAAKMTHRQELETLKMNQPTEAGRSLPLDDISGISAYVGISYDFTNKVFHADCEVYVKVLGGLLEGVGENARAGSLQIHFAPDKWYVYMGTPNNPIGLKFSLVGIDVITKAYFMLGSDIPGSPPPPQEVADILGVSMKNLDYMSNLNELKGGGIAFGAHVSVSTGDLTFLLLYANFQAGVGFDLMLKQYGDAQCEGRSGPIGINGWYANAQAYAYLQGEVGVKVNLWFIKARIPIIQGAAAALVQAKLPNPSWFRGYLAIRFSVLGGLVRGNVRFELTIGEECKIVRANETPLAIDVISDMNPREGEKVDVFAAPQVTLNFPVGKDIEIKGEHGTQIFRVVLDELKIQEVGKTGEIPGRIEWNGEKDRASFYSKDVLPPNAKLKVFVKVSFQENKGGNWQTVYMNGKKAEEKREINLTSGAAPDNIPLSNIKYAWPVVDQYNFYRDENDKKGVIQLDRGQPYLFDTANYKQELFMEPDGDIGTNSALAFEYDKGQCQLRFPIAHVRGKGEYQVSIQSKPIAKANTEKPVPAAPKTAVTSDEGKISQNTDLESPASLDLEVKKTQAEAVKREDIGKTILTYKFQSSEYGTFQQKMQSIQYGETIWSKICSDVISLQQSVAQAEAFDLNDLQGSKYTDNKPLVQPEAILDNAYFLDDIYPIAYKTYPIAGNIQFTRDTTLFGFIPKRALPVLPGYLSAIESANMTDGLVKTTLPYEYDLPRIYKEDFSDLQNQVVNRYLHYSQPPAEYLYLVDGHFPFLRKGTYKVNYQYVIPGGTKGSAYTVTYTNEMND